VLSSLVPCNIDPQVSLTFSGKRFAFPMDSFNVGQVTSGSTDCVGGIMAMQDIDCGFGFLLLLLLSSGVLTTLNMFGYSGLNFYQRST